MHRETNNEHLVTFRQVQKSYDGDNLIVKNLNLNIQKGEFLTLLGPSGSGKTTCLMMLAGFETPTSGDIYLGEKRLNNLPPHRRDIGMVFQNYALFPHMTVAENLAFPLAVRKQPKHEITQHVEQALSMVRLEKFAARYPGQLSGGQQQRIALARALVFKPQLVLMDEPLGALDKQLREHMQIEIKHLHEQLGITVVYVTHDQSEALTMSDRIAVFHEGEIQQIDTAEALYESPNNAFVASFIGENNRLKGSLKSVCGSKCQLVLDSGEEITALNLGNDNIGLQMEIAVRPERVLLNAESLACDNLFAGQIKEVIYLGDHLRICINAFGGKTIFAKVSIHQLETSIQVGNIIRFGWSSQHCRAFQHRQ